MTRTRHASVLRWVALVGTGAAMMGCSGADGTGPGAGRGDLAVYLTDLGGSPAMVQAALEASGAGAVPMESIASIDVFVVRIDVKREATTELEAADSASVDVDTTATDSTASDSTASDSTADATATPITPAKGGWVTVAEPNAAIDLLTLGSAEAALGEASLPVGTYRSVRLILDPARSSVTLADGTVLAGDGQPGIVFPSAARTGLKIHLDRAVEVEEGESKLAVGFDLGRSLAVRGSLATNGLLFKPVLKGAEMPAQ